MIKFLYIMGNVAESLINNIPVIILGIILFAVGISKDFGAAYFAASVGATVALYFILMIIRKIMNKNYK